MTFDAATFLAGLFGDAPEAQANSLGVNNVAPKLSPPRAGAERRRFQTEAVEVAPGVWRDPGAHDREALAAMRGGGFRPTSEWFDAIDRWNSQTGNGP